MPEASTNRPYTNGHLSPPAGQFDNHAMATSSESDLSEVIDPPKPMSPSSHELQAGSEHDFYSRRDSLSSEDADAIGSDDADYMVESPPPPAIHVTRDARSSSQDSRRPPKRKAGIEEDEFIMNNPELYGIRRSVCTRSLSYFASGLMHSRLVLVLRTESYANIAPIQYELLSNLVTVD